MLIKYNGKDKNYIKRWWCQCDCGNPELKLVAESQLKSGKTKSCGCLATKNKHIIGKNNTKISFKKWCEENNRHDLLELWNNDLNNELPNDIGCSSSKDFYFICKNDETHKLKFKPQNITKNGTGFQLICPTCNSFGYNLKNIYGENALEKYWDYDKNKEIEPMLIPKNTNKKLFIYCQKNKKHGSYEVSGSHFWQRNQRCPYCSHSKIIKEESLGFLFPKAVDIWSEKNKIFPYDVSESSGKRIVWKCENNIHSEYTRSIKDSKKALFTCPKCKESSSESNLEKIVKSFIKSEYPYTLNTEYDCTIIPINPKTKQKLPYDNEIKELKLIIEVNGEQHYQICHLTKLSAKRYNKSSVEALDYQKWKDNYKRQYALDNGYSYLEIPYWSIEDETYKEIIGNRINELCYKKP